MKEVFIAYSKYNQKTNEIVTEYIRSMSPEQIKNEISAYYKTIIDTLIHVMSSDIKWLDRLSRFYKSSITSDVLDKFKTAGQIDIEKVIEKRDILIEIQKKIDIDIIKIIEAISENDFTNDIEIPWRTGSIKRKLWILLFQWFNHHTHHRGQISVQLDCVGIDNDYSSVLDKIE
jgi:uncharacterized damage-inducible protein DinB